MAMFLIALLFSSLKCCGTEAQPDNNRTIANMRINGFDALFILDSNSICRVAPLYYQRAAVY
jgi:hypothetical protein